MVVTDPFDVTVFGKVSRQEYVNLDSVTFWFSTVITWFRSSNFTDRLPLKKIQIDHSNKLVANLICNISANIASFLIPDERCNPRHCVHMLTCYDQKGTEKSLCSLSQNITGFDRRIDHGNKPVANPIRNISANIASFFDPRWALSSSSLYVHIGMLRLERHRKITVFSLPKYRLGPQETF